MSTGIQWTDETWNPTVGCDRISPGCAHCYAKTLHDKRHAAHQRGRNVPAQYAQPFEVLQLMEGRLDAPLHWRQPRRVFVNSVSDLFHEDVPDAFIDRVFAVMALARRHTFQILTKRAERMRDHALSRSPQTGSFHVRMNAILQNAGENEGSTPEFAWPLPNVWLGVSVENQRFADERIPLLLQTPAAVRFISAEPLLGPVDFRWARWDDHGPHPRRAEQLPPVSRDGCTLAGSVSDLDGLRMLDWVIVGGESGGADARPFDIAWARSIVTQCQAAGVPVFVKQLGANARLSTPACQKSAPYCADGHAMELRDHKGGDPSEWPEDLRVREYPVEEAASGR